MEYHSPIGAQPVDIWNAKWAIRDYDEVIRGGGAPKTGQIRVTLAGLYEKVTYNKKGNAMEVLPLT